MDRAGLLASVHSVYFCHSSRAFSLRGICFIDFVRDFIRAAPPTGTGFTNVLGKGTALHAASNSVTD